MAKHFGRSRSLSKELQKSDKARKMERMVLVDFTDGIGMWCDVIAGGWVLAAGMAAVGLAEAHKYFGSTVARVGCFISASISAAGLLHHFSTQVAASM